MLIDPVATSSADIYRVMIRAIVPRPIAWVSTISEDGLANVAPFSFFTAITTNPPTLCFAPGRRTNGGGKKDTLRNIEATGEFVVNVVTEALAEKMNRTATDFPSGVSEFDEVGLTATPSQLLGAPRVAESPVSFECRRYDVVHIGPSGVGGGALVIGEIVMIHVDESIVSDGKIDPERLAAVGRLGGMEYTRTRDRFTMVREKYSPK